jgi:hypothetical protein
VQSMAYQLTLAVFERLRLIAQEQGCTPLNSPPLPLVATNVGRQRVLLVLRSSDRLIDAAGKDRERLTEQRRLRLLVGAAAFTDSAVADADALHFLARVALRSAAFRTALKALGAVGPIREVELMEEEKSVVAEGSALMSAFEIEYFQTYPAA